MIKKILVTGGAGFIGSNTTQLLCDLGYKVVVLDDLSSGFRKLVDKRAKFINASLANYQAIKQALRGIDAVMHFAASTIIKFSIADPVGFIHNNINNGVNLLEAMRERKVRKIIFSSTASVYGEPVRIPAKEDDPKNPIQSYGASKLAFEKILSGYCSSYGIESTSLRYFNVYGPHDEQEPAVRAVPVWSNLILNKRPIPLYWQGKQIRDYVFVKDIAQAHIDVLKLKGLNVFNIGSGKGVVMKDLLEELFEAIGYRTPIKDLGERPGDPMKLVADVSKIKKAVNWKPKVSLKKGINETIKYYKELQMSNLSK